MNSCSQVMTELRKLGTQRNRKIFERHGVPDDYYGVSVADLKIVAKKIKGNQELACELFDTGNVDAMYLAGIVADGSKMSKKQLDRWARQAEWSMISEYSVPGVAHEHPEARSLALGWMRSKKAHVAAAGWCTYSGIVATRSDDALDLDEISQLLQTIVESIRSSENRVRYTMNGFVISVGGYVRPLSKEAKSAAKKIGKVEVDMGGTACKVPEAVSYIQKMESAGRAGKKRKTIKC